MQRIKCGLTWWGFEYDPDCNGAEDYAKVANFFLGIEDKPQGAPPAVPIQIRDVNLPTPHCYAHVTIRVEPAATAPEPAQSQPPADTPAPPQRSTGLS